MSRFGSVVLGGSGGRAVAEVGLRHAVATRVGVGVLVEMRHRGAGNAATDHRDELIAAELAAPQIGGAARRLSLPGAVAGPAVAIAAVGLFEKDAPALREVLRRRWRCRANGASVPDSDGAEKADAAWSIPDLPRYLDDEAQLGDLVCFGHAAHARALHAARKAALRADGELLERHVPRRLLDAAFERVLAFELLGLGRDEAQHHRLALRQEAQRFEAAGARAVVFKEIGG